MIHVPKDGVATCVIQKENIMLNFMLMLATFATSSLWMMKCPFKCIFLWLVASQLAIDPYKIGMHTY
jgi:hypothetical protein